VEKTLILRAQNTAHGYWSSATSRCRRDCRR